jgi:GDP-L-fucose synthase
MENVDTEDIIKLNQDKARQADYHAPHFINIGTEEEVSINDLALKIKKLTGFRGNISFDHSKPDGTMRKTIDCGLLKKLGYRHEFNLDTGLAETYKLYCTL